MSESLLYCLLTVDGDPPEMEAKLLHTALKIVLECRGLFSCCISLWAVCNFSKLPLAGFITCSAQLKFSGEL